MWDLCERWAKGKLGILSHRNCAVRYLNIRLQGIRSRIHKRTRNTRFYGTPVISVGTMREIAVNTYLGSDFSSRCNCFSSGVCP